MNVIDWHGTGARTQGVKSGLIWVFGAPVLSTTIRTIDVLYKYVTVHTFQLFHVGKRFELEGGNAREAI